MRGKGFVYTLYIVLVLNLLLATMLVSMEWGETETSVSTGVSELSSFVRSFENDMDRGADISGRRSMVASVSHVIDTGEPLEDAENSVSELFLEGSIEGNDSSIMERTSFSDWVSRMENQAEEEEYSFWFGEDEMFRIKSRGFRVILGLNHSYSINDTVNDAGFKRPDIYREFSIEVEGVDDPLVMLETGGSYSNIIEKCGFPPVEYLGPGEEYEYNYTEDGGERNWVSGKSEVFNGDDVSDVGDRSEKILFTEDLCDYGTDILDDFKGVVSEETTDGMDVCGSGEEIKAYIGGYTDVGTVAEGEIMVMDDENIWENNMVEIIDERCFFKDDSAPGMMQRLEGEYSGSEGFATLLDVPSLPSENQFSNRTAVDYLYFSEESSSRKIKGVSDRTGYSWFRLDVDHVLRWDINELDY